MRVKNIQIEVEDDETTLGIIILTLQDKIKTLEEKTERLESSLNETLEYLAKESKTMTQECPFNFEDENGFTDYRENELCPKCGEDKDVPRLDFIEEYPGELEDFIKDCPNFPCHYEYLLEENKDKLEENEDEEEYDYDETFEIIKCPICECPEERGSMYEHIRHYHPDEDDYLRAYL